MDDPRLDDHVSDELTPRPEFRAELRGRLVAEWSGRSAATGRRRRRAVLAGAAAALVAAAAVTVVVVTGDDGASTVRPADSSGGTADPSGVTEPTGSTEPPTTVPGPTTPADTDLAAAITGVNWTVWEWNGARTSGTPTFTLAADGTVTGFDGCNGYETEPGTEGRWRVEDGLLRLPPTLRFAAMECFRAGVMPLVDGTTLSFDAAAGVLRMTSPDGANRYMATTSSTLDVGTTEVPADLAAEPLDRTVLYTATVGAGDGQLGREDCQECEPTRPMAPVLTPQGTVIIPDLANGRWVIVDGADVRTVPMDGGLVGQPLLVGSWLYAPMNTADDPPSTTTVRAYDTTDMTTVVEELPMTTDLWRTLVVSGNHLFAGATELRELSPYDAAATMVPAFDQAPNTMDVTWNSVHRRWQFPSWATVPTALTDGTVLVGADLGGTDSIVRLFPDGTMAAGTLAAPTDAYGWWTAGQLGIVQIEFDGTRFEVARYALPRPSGPLQIDVETGALLGFVPGPQDADEVVAAVTAAIGAPVTDSGWAEVSRSGGSGSEWECSGATEWREVSWDGATATFVRQGGWVELVAWSLADGVATSNGLAIGTPRAEVLAAWADRVTVFQNNATVTIKWDVLTLAANFDAQDEVATLTVERRLCS